MLNANWWQNWTIVLPLFLSFTSFCKSSDLSLLAKREICFLRNFLADSWPRSIVGQLTSQGRPPSASSALLLGTSGPRWQRPVPQCRRTMPWWIVVQCRRTMPTCRASSQLPGGSWLGRGARPPPSSSQSLHVIICDLRRLEGKPKLIFVEICQDE